ncbi:hypothetical protein QWJ90_06675 [Microbacterium oryzae]|uniref:hypothetical protein n=1 Tax=Microbacterium oryzae TaxID=743009 RepID=UPI0025AFF73C|nr:hypothetical protein [Microbacterium oryzae]MDN3310609.1 hypothetical protein [Microbacterium oryzae]
MNTATRLSLYGAGLVAAFAAAFGLGAVAVPGSAVSAWNEGVEMSEHGEMHVDASSEMHGEASSAAQGSPAGVSLSAGGYVLAPVAAPGTVGEAGELRFRILDEGGHPLIDYATQHGKELHLIVVRVDGAQFRHVHPELDTTSGTWSLPWTWEAAGTYRVYADFAAPGAEGVTLSRMVQVAGGVTPAVTEVRTTAEADGYTVRLEGELVAGASRALTLEVSRDGSPVTTLEPYLGAFGRLVALREGDLAYLHVHPEGDEPATGASGGPAIRFTAAAPTAGRYLLYLDFQVAGEVHTAEFALDAMAGGEHE